MFPPGRRVGNGVSVAVPMVPAEGGFGTHGLQGSTCEKSFYSNENPILELNP